MEQLGDKVRSLENLVNSKLAIRLTQLVKDFGEAMVILNQSMTSIEEDFSFIKGPLLDDFKCLKHENQGF